MRWRIISTASAGFILVFTKGKTRGRMSATTQDSANTCIQAEAAVREGGEKALTLQVI
jgi:hypothetical protein